eukprot:symbB.v1.2.024640.t1/scaffold2346.1/size82077/1
MDHSAGFPPAPSALSNQQRILQSRFPPARSRDEDEVRSTTGSVSSWVEVPAGEEAPDSDGLEMPSADLRLGTANKMDPIPEHGPNAPSMAPPQLHTAAPVTQAARNFVDHTNEPAAARRLRKQQEMAQRKGRRGARFVQLGAHNACNIALPPHIQQVGSGQGERSIMVLDHRDLRLQSPFQGWLLDEILTNAGARINIQSDARLVRSPTTGYHCNMFMLKTLDNFKLVIAGSMTSYGSVPCGKWDSATGEVLSHDAFQPFRWPVMRNDSPTWVDFKIKLEGHLLVHLELRGYRSDQDMSVQINHVTDSILWLLQETAFIPTCVVTVFQGWRVCACSWEVGGRIYAISEGGIVVALDYPLCHMEIRLVATSSADAFGQDADRLEFRFYSAADRLDVACSTCAAPPSWLIVSRVSGPTLIKNASWCRNHMAMDRGARSGTAALAVGVDPCSLDGGDGVPKQQAIVEKDALAVQAHDPATEQATAILPPITGGPAVQPAGNNTASMKALTGDVVADQSRYPHRGVSLSEQEVSVTAPGVLPDKAFAPGSTLAPSRRTLDQRRSETVDFSAMTPSGFCGQGQEHGVSWIQLRECSSSE